MIGWIGVQPRKGNNCQKKSEACNTFYMDTKVHHLSSSYYQLSHYLRCLWIFAQASLAWPFDFWYVWWLYSQTRQFFKEDLQHFNYNLWTDWRRGGLQRWCGLWWRAPIIWHGWRGLRKTILLERSFTTELSRGIRKVSILYCTRSGSNLSQACDLGYVKVMSRFPASQRASYSRLSHAQYWPGSGQLYGQVLWRRSWEDTCWRCTFAFCTTPNANHERTEEIWNYSNDERSQYRCIHFPIIRSPNVSSSGWLQKATTHSYCCYWQLSIISPWASPRLAFIHLRLAVSASKPCWTTFQREDP